jgi:hypothetical protein
VEELTHANGPISSPMPRMQHAPSRTMYSFVMSGPDIENISNPLQKCELQFGQVPTGEVFPTLLQLESPTLQSLSAPLSLSINQPHNIPRKCPFITPNNRHRLEYLRATNAIDKKYISRIPIEPLPEGLRQRQMLDLFHSRTIIQEV